MLVHLETQGAAQNRRRSKSKNNKRGSCYFSPFINKFDSGTYYSCTIKCVLKQYYSFNFPVLPTSQLRAVHNFGIGFMRNCIFNDPYWLFCSLRVPGYYCEPRVTPPPCAPQPPLQPPIPPCSPPQPLTPIPIYQYLVNTYCYLP